MIKYQRSLVNSYSKEEFMYVVVFATTSGHSISESKDQQLCVILTHAELRVFPYFCMFVSLLIMADEIKS